MKQLLLPLLCLLAFHIQASGLPTGKIVGIIDGDTVTLLTADKWQIKIRLAEIDTPEKKQPYGNRSKQALIGNTVSRGRIPIFCNSLVAASLVMVALGNANAFAELTLYNTTA